VIVGLLLVLSFTTVKRNILWQTPLEFYANEVANAPQHARANASYGNELMKLGRFDEAEAYLKKSVDINLAKNKVTASGLTSYITVLYHLHKYQKASQVAVIGLKYVNTPVERSALLGKMAYGYMQMGIYDFAKGLLSKALTLDPNNSEVRANLELCLLKLKQQNR
jgi:tetratricopeptide (TPR) repeat protein